MELCEATRKSLREEAQRVGISVEALLEWIELCGVKAQLEVEMEQVERAMERHQRRHRKGEGPRLRLVGSEA